MIKTFSKPGFRTFNFLAVVLLVFLSFQNASAKAPLDFDGDGKTDYAVLRTSNDQNQFLINWYISLSSGGSLIQQFGIGSLVTPRDKIIPEDYDGDGKCDIAVYRRFSGGGMLYVLESGTNSFKATYLPDFRAQIIVQDYDGDGKADIADIWPDDNNNKIWHILESKSGTIRTVYFGTNSLDHPVKGDFDGDGLGDVAVYRTGSTAAVNTFYVLRSSDGKIEAMTFGKTGDMSRAVDFDGDGKTDYAVTREFESGANRTMWYWIESSTGEFRSLHFGDSFHEAVAPGDYDGDGKTDQAITRLDGQNIIWYVNGSNRGMTAEHWGTGTDTLVINPYY